MKEFGPHWDGGKSGNMHEWNYQVNETPHSGIQEQIPQATPTQDGAALVDGGSRNETRGGIYGLDDQFGVEHIQRKQSI